METYKLYDSELKVMDVIWEKEPITAKEISLILADTIGWNKNTTYTMINKLQKKQMIARQEPNFICVSLIQKSEVQRAETSQLIDKFYNGSKKLFFASFLQNEKLSEDEINELKRLINKSYDDN